MGSNLVSREARFWAKVDRKGDDECWPWTGAKSASGYGHLANEVGRKPRLLAAPRLSLMIAMECDDPGPKVYCLHSCDNPACVNPAHLRWGTPSENIRDGFARGRMDRSGPRAKRPRIQPTAALTEEQAREIMRQCVAGKKTGEIAAAVGAPYNSVADIVRGRSYAFLHGQDGLPTKEELLAARRGNLSVSDEMALAMIRARLAGEGTRAAAKRIGIPDDVAADIARGKTYRHLHGANGIPDAETIRAGGQRPGHNWRDLHR